MSHFQTHFTQKLTIIFLLNFQDRQNQPRWTFSNIVWVGQISGGPPRGISKKLLSLRKVGVPGGNRKIFYPHYKENGYGKLIAVVQLTKNRPREGQMTHLKNLTQLFGQFDTIFRPMEFQKLLGTKLQILMEILMPSFPKSYGSIFLSVQSKKKSLFSV